MEKKMTKFAVHTIETAPAAAKDKLAQVQKGWGFIPTLHATMAESPETLEAYDTLFALVSKTSLTPQEQQVVFLAVSVMHECEYCTMGHTYLGRMVKLDEAAIQSLRNGTAIADKKLQALRSFTELVVRERGFAGDKAVDSFIAAGFTKQNVLEVVTVIATKTISNYVNHLTHTPQESFMADPSFTWVAPRNRAKAA
jgi:AhpD family alkylhydroperoxidase